MKDHYALTWSFLNSRVKKYRFTAISLIVVLFLSVGLSIVFRQPTILFGLLFLPGIVLLWLTLDVISMAKWERATLSKWREGDFPLEIFAQGLKASAGPLASSIQGLIQILPIEFGNDSPTEKVGRSISQKSQMRYQIQKMKLGLAWLIYGVGCWFVGVFWK
jgi:hypothetical protein